MEDKRFCSGERTLLLVCEEGEEEYAPEQFATDSVKIRVVEAPEQLTRENLEQWLRETRAERVVIEYNGMWMLDQLYAAMPEDVLKTEIDVCWVKYAGEDPAAYLRKYAGRAPVVHLKDFVGRKEGDAAPYGLLGQSETKAAGEVPFEFRPVGYGCQDVSAVAEAGLDAGAKWFVVEQDASVGRTPLEAADMSIDTLRKIGLKG